MTRNKIFLALLGGIFLISLMGHEASGQEVLTWENCVEEAKNNHPDITVGREDVVQAEAEKTIARSDMLPQIDFSVSADTSTDYVENDDSYSQGFSGRQLLFDGFKTLNEYNRAQQQLLGARFNYMYISSVVRFRLRSAFVSLLREQEGLKIADEILKRRQDNLELVKLRYEGGREHKGALLTAQANLAQAQADVHSAKRNIDVARRKLIKEMGRSKYSPVESAGTFVVIDPQAEQPDFESLAEATPLLRQLITRTEEAKFDHRVSIGDFFPEVSLSSGIDRFNDEWPPRNESWSIGVSLDFNIFDGGSRAGFLKRTKSSLRQSKASERSGRDEIILTLNETWAALQDALENVTVQASFLESAQARAKISEEQYSNGLISFDDWIIIEDSLVRTRSTFLNAQRDALLAEAEWVQAKGGTLDNE